MPKAMELPLSMTPSSCCRVAALLLTVAATSTALTPGDVQHPIAFYIDASCTSPVVLHRAWSDVCVTEDGNSMALTACQQGVSATMTFFDKDYCAAGTEWQTVTATTSCQPYSTGGIYMKMTSAPCSAAGIVMYNIQYSAAADCSSLGRTKTTLAGTCLDSNTPAPGTSLSQPATLTVAGGTPPLVSVSVLRDDCSPRSTSIYNVVNAPADGSCSVQAAYGSVKVWSTVPPYPPLPTPTPSVSPTPSGTPSGSVTPSGSRSYGGTPSPTPTPTQTAVNPVACVDNVVLDMAAVPAASSVRKFACTLQGGGSMSGFAQSISVSNPYRANISVLFASGSSCDDTTTSIRYATAYSQRYTTASALSFPQSPCPSSQICCYVLACFGSPQGQAGGVPASDCPRLAVQWANFDATVASSSGLPVGARVGIAIGVIVVVGAIGATVAYVRTQAKRNAHAAIVRSTVNGDVTTTVITGNPLAGPVPMGVPIAMAYPPGPAGAPPPPPPPPGHPQLSPGYRPPANDAFAPMLGAPVPDIPPPPGMSAHV